YDVTVKSLAKDLHISESHFIHLFTSAMHCSPMKYIRKVRLTDAESLLKAGTPVSEVAEKCGYSSSTALWKAIRKNYGCTPSELKKK
ncbi:MAG: helix-turn-helix transcriptional regulator, partial [Clostridia bacterium]|nr:helix-turn-helix transcriptional regulator [Clostridia bacterium]